MFERHEPDLVLLDLRLPDMVGFDVCRTIRNRSIVPIVIVTAQMDTVDLVAGLEAGADDYVTKPVVIKELAARIRALLRRVQLQEAAPPKPVVFGDLEIRREQGVVLKNGEPLALTKTEFLLLCEFAEHADMVLSRDQLLERVWGYDYLGDSRLVDAHVRRLRVKVEDQPEEPTLILTVRGHRLPPPRPVPCLARQPPLRFGWSYSLRSAMHRRRCGPRLHGRRTVRAGGRSRAQPGRDRPQEGLDLLPVAGAAHRREGAHHVPSVAGRSQPRVEHGEHAAVRRSADQAAAGLGQQRGRAREVDAPERLGPEALPPGLQQRFVRAGEGEAIDRDERQRAAGHVDALEQARGREQARGLLGAEAGEQRGLGEIVLGQHGARRAEGPSAAAASCMARRLVKRASVRPPAAVMRACSSACTPAWWAGWRGSGRWAAQ